MYFHEKRLIIEPASDLELQRITCWAKERFSGMVAKVEKGSFLVTAQGVQSQIIGFYNHGSYLGVQYQGKWPSNLEIQTASGILALIPYEQLPQTLQEQVLQQEMSARSAAIKLSEMTIENRLLHALKLIKRAKRKTIAEITGTNPQTITRNLSSLTQRRYISRKDLVYSLREEALIYIDQDLINTLTFP